MNAIELKFKYAEGEYVAAYRKYFLAKRRAFFMMTMATGLLVIGMYFLISGSDVALTVAFFSTGALLFGLLISSSILLPRQRFRNDPRFRGEYRLRFTDDGIEFHTNEIDAKISWRIYKEALETKDFFLLSDGAATLSVIPKRAFVSAEQESQFKELIDAKV
jgi:YcxB-like protein